MEWKSSFRCNMFFVPLGDPAPQSLLPPLLLSYTPIPFPRHCRQFPRWEHFNHDGRSIYPHPLHTHTRTQSLTHFNTHPLGGEKASLVWSVIALLSFPPCASSAITIIRKITLQILFNTEPTEEYWFLSHLPSWHYLSVNKTSHSEAQEKRSELPLTAETCRSSVFYLLPVLKIDPRCQVPTTFFPVSLSPSLPLLLTFFSYSHFDGCSHFLGHYKPRDRAVHGLSL